MHPAKSVILFTTASGAGYGLIVALILLHLSGSIDGPRILPACGFGLAFALITVGLLSSTFHLGHPERAWRALSQWRTSWLSREGVLAILTYIPSGLYALAWFGGWPASDPRMIALGLVAIAFSLVTVFCTAMIYASLKTVHAWCNRWTPAAYLFLSLATGGVLAVLLLASFGLGIEGAAKFAIAGLAGAAAAKLAYWRHIAETASASTAGTATGLGGTVRLLEGPHTGTNYLMQEMGFQIARKHAARLRQIAFATGFAIPLALLALIALGIAAGSGATTAAIAAVTSAAAGVVVERWLFFAEAKHTAMLYYGANTA